MKNMDSTECSLKLADSIIDFLKVEEFRIDSFKLKRRTMSSKMIDSKTKRCRRGFSLSVFIENCLENDFEKWKTIIGIFMESDDNIKDYSVKIENISEVGLYVTLEFKIFYSTEEKVESLNKFKFISKFQE